MALVALRVQLVRLAQTELAEMAVAAVVQVVLALSLALEGQAETVA